MRTNSSQNSMPLNQVADLATTHLLVRRAKQGEQEALGELLRRYQPRVRKIVRLRLGNSNLDVLDLDDILQETLVAAFKAFERFELRNEASVINWLSKIAERKILSASEYLAAQKRVRDKELALDYEDSEGVVFDVPDERRGPMTSVSTREEWRLIEDCIAELPETYREIIVLRECLGYGWEDVAREHGRPTVDAARKMHATAMLKLNELIRERLRE